MIERYRVHEVAKDLRVPGKNITSKDIVDLLGKYFAGAKTHMAALEKDELSVVFEHFTRQNEVENFDEYFAMAANKPAKAPAPPAQTPAPVADNAQKAPARQEQRNQSNQSQPKAQGQQRPQGQQQGQAQQGQQRPQGQQQSQAQQGQQRPQGQQQSQAQQGQQRPQGQQQGQAQQGQQRPQGQQQGQAQQGQQRPQGQQQGQAQQGQQRPQGQQQKAKQPQQLQKARPKTTTVRPQPPTGGQGSTGVVQASEGAKHVDIRSVKVNLDKYNERYETIAPTNLAKKDTGVRKQKLGSKQRGKPFMSRREQEAAKLRKIEMERERRQKLDITLPEEIAVSELASRLKIQTAEVVKKLMGLGIMASAGQIIDYDTAAMVAMEIGAKVSPEVIVTIEERLFDETEDASGDLMERSPVVVVMGHVDHGKTSLLDAIRDTNVTSGEAGGITQNIGAYQVEANGRKITFLDTPGHAAFTSMRARGAQVTDIAVLVVAADDGVMPQTVEAINHAKAAGVSIIVAINKIDKEAANPERVKQELTEHELVSEEWGGDTICVPISAKTRQGIDNLLEMILLMSEMKELKANPDRMAKGTVIEASLDKGRGPVATILVQNGTLKIGDVIIAGTALGRVRVMQNDRGEKLETAGPSTPVEITGLSEVPQAGDVFNAVEDEKLARELVEKRRHEAKEEMFSAYQRVTMENLFSQISQGQVKELAIIVKADVQGSVEALSQNLEKLSNDEVRVKVIHGGVGAVVESDVMLANASNAIIVGFNVRPDPVARQTATQEGVDIRLHRVIYDAIDEINDAMKGMLSPKYRDIDLGRAEVRAVYKISNVGTVAGCYVQEGKITRSAKIRVVRDGIIIADDAIDSLRRFKDDVREVASGYECGIGLQKFSDIKDGDVFEAYETEQYRD